MCGIAGFFQREEVPIERVNTAFDDLRRRGPDGEGSLFFNPEPPYPVLEEPAAGSVGLLQTLLAIRDLTKFGQQPMCNEDRSVWIVYNGEVYGWEDERNKLKIAGHKFRGSSDTEFILHGYEEWGQGILDRLRGMFAFAILDLRKRTWFLARDRIGKKPCYWTREGGFAFASNLKTLVALVGKEKLKLNPQAIDAYLAHRYIPSPLSLYQGVYKLPAAHCMTIPMEGGSPTIREYWKPTPTPTFSPLDELDTAVALRLASNREIGLFLSGGIDSRAIAKVLAKDPKRRLKAYTAVFDDFPDFNEHAEAQATAEEFRLQHHRLHVLLNPKDHDKIISDLDEPFADPSCLPTWALCREASKEFVVALTGDGGDELFAGYKRYDKHLSASQWKVLPVYQPNRFPNHAAVIKKKFSGRMRRLVMEQQLGRKDAYVLRFSGFDPTTRAWLQPDMSVDRPHYWRMPQGRLPLMDWMLECDRLNYLPDYILKKGDLCGMAHGLDLRATLLDHVLYSKILGLRPDERFTKPSKKLLRAYSNCKSDMSKRGFNPPLGSWLRDGATGLDIETLGDRLAQVTGNQLHPERVREFLKYWDDGHVSAELIWQLDVLEKSLENLNS
jgi:asparagine synthase (glutamine-hydrolysing)